MTGFIKGLFGRKKQENSPESEQVSRKQGSYYLEPDDAKTFGDIDYMRSSKTVKRTFAKGDARVRQISSMKDEDANGITPTVQPSVSSTENSTNSAAQSTGSQKTSSFSPQNQRRTADSSMDTFRNMAKEIRKK